MSGTSAYAFDNASEHAGGRFDALQTCYDPVTFARLADLGVTPGMRCLDVGGGGGSLDDLAFAANSYPLISTWGTRP